MQECLKIEPGTGGCIAFDSVEEVIAGSVEDTGAPNFPNWPFTNGKCRWNGATPADARDCIPYFHDDTPGTDFHDWTCALRDQYIAEGRQVQDDDAVNGSLWAPCFDAAYRAVKFNWWPDLGSSIQWLQVGEFTPQAVELPEHTWTQHEILFSPDMFYDPITYGSGSNTSKLMRWSRQKDDDCTDDRLFDERMAFFTDRVELFFESYCPGVASANRVSVPAVLANTWLRVTVLMDRTSGTATMWVNRSATGEEVGVATGDYSTLANAATSWRVWVHSTSRGTNGTRAPGWAMRHFILSENEIAR